jgi:uncharacterized CHY-type Zn-finger protein
MKIVGILYDNQTRCIHYHSNKDIIAIKFKCCEIYYPCYFCHKEMQTHNILKWKKSNFMIIQIQILNVHIVNYTIIYILNLFKNTFNFSSFQSYSNQNSDCLT